MPRVVVICPDLRLVEAIEYLVVGIQMPFGGPNQEMRGWTKHKLKYLRSYISAYRRATKSAYKTYYIDGFAGPGRLPDEETKEMVDGSPLIALRTEPRFTRCFLIEMNPKVCEGLRKEVEGFEHAVVLQGDSNDLIPKILARIDARSPVLVVLDPTGVIGQVKWATVEAIAKKRTEVFINFPYHMAVQRILPVDHSQLTQQRIREIDLYLPPGWLEVYHRSVGYERGHLCKRLLELYRDRLRDLGYQYVYASGAFRNDEGVPLYYLMWAGKNEIGAKIAKYVILKQFDPHIRLFNVDDDSWLGH